MSFLLAFVTQKINLTFARYCLILELYPDLMIAALDNFRLCQNQKWLEKWSVTTKDGLGQKLAELEIKLRELNIELLAFCDDNYPVEFKSLSDYPLVLYYQGQITLLQNQAKITIVGSRNIHQYTKQVLEVCLNPIVDRLTTVSGLALGVDAAVHNSSTMNSGKTIAIIGSGLDDKSFYPSFNLNLKAKILESGGLIISEYASGTKPTPFSFPRRNRLLAALSSTTWVVQASQKSGSLITARVALELGHNVATTPASIVDNNFAGNISLMRDGANLICDSADLLGLLNLSQNFLQNKIVSEQITFTSDAQKLIYENLSAEPINLDKLQEITGINLQLLNSNLTLLEIGGLVSSIGNNDWIKE